MPKLLFTLREQKIRIKDSARLLQIQTMEELGYIQTAADAGLVTGYAGEFRPRDTITREKMAVLIMWAYNITSGKKPEGASQSSFTDSDTLSPWAVEPLFFICDKI